jgi:hypothetical protein
MRKLEQLHQMLRSTSSKVQRNPRWMMAGAAGVVLVAAGVYVAVEGSPRMVAVVQDQLVKPSLEELSARVRRDPSDGRSQRELGHALFEKNKRLPGLRSYERALVQDRSLLDDTLLANLVKAYGTPEQGDASSLITRMKLVEVESKLDDLAKDTRYKVRWAALQTLERLGKASRQDFVSAWMADLASQDCDIRRSAVENLGHEGDKRALSAIREAKKKDKGTGNWFTGTCLGDRPEEAEKRILATR